MKLPRDLAGEELVARLCGRWGYRQVHQQGSHIVLETSEPSHHRIAVPAHATLRIGALNSILRAVSRHKGVSREEILATLWQTQGEYRCGLMDTHLVAVP